LQTDLAWQSTADPTPAPAGFTPAGSGVIVSPVVSGGSAAGISLTFASVSSPGATSVVITSSGPPLTQLFQLDLPFPPVFYNISTTAAYAGQVTICLPYGASEGYWTNITSTIDSADGSICGVASSLSPFVVAQRLSASQSIGPLGPAASPSSADGYVSPTSGSPSSGLATGLIVALVVVVVVAAAAVVKSQDVV
jgi:hypothetical protein